MVTYTHNIRYNSGIRYHCQAFVEPKKCLKQLILSTYNICLTMYKGMFVKAQFATTHYYVHFPCQDKSMAYSNYTVALVRYIHKV